MLKCIHNCRVTYHIFLPTFVIFFLKMTISMPVDVQMIWIAFCGGRNRKQEEKTELDIPWWNKNGKILAFVLFKEAVCCSHELYSFLCASGGTGYGLQRWTKRGYRHTSLMWYLFRIQVRNRSKPKPYPPWGHVPYFLCLKRREECLVYSFV